MDRKRVLFLPQWIDFDVERGILDYAREAGWQLISISDHGGDSMPVLRSCPAIDGIITLIKYGDSDLAQHVAGSLIPVVELAETVPSIDVPRVVLDHNAIGQLGANHLLDHGLEHFVFPHFQDHYQLVARGNGFRDHVRACGGTIHDINLPEAGLGLTDRDRSEERIPWLADQLSKLPKPIGLMLHYDSVYWMIVDACKIAGLRIPEDIAVVSVGNTESVCELTNPTLSSIEHNQTLQGYRAAWLLDALIDGAHPPDENLRIPPSFVAVRESTDILAVPDDTLRQALKFLREHFDDPRLCVDDVVSATGTSKRGLYSLFHDHWHQSIKHTLTSFRIEEAKRLLADTELKAYVVAMQTGFGSQAQFIRAFRKDVGMPPSEFRDAVRGSSVVHH